MKALHAQAAALFGLLPGLLPGPPLVLSPCPVAEAGHCGGAFRLRGHPYGIWTRVALVPVTVCAFTAVAVAVKERVPGCTGVKLAQTVRPLPGAR